MCNGLHASLYGRIKINFLALMLACFEPVLGGCGKYNVYLTQTGSIKPEPATFSIL
jgi:hypothetical protein